MFSVLVKLIIENKNKMILKTSLNCHKYLLRNAERERVSNIRGSQEAFFYVRLFSAKRKCLTNEPPVSWSLTSLSKRITTL